MGVQKILRTKDYYVILGVPKDASEDAVKKAYKKLALKLHPDKNKAPGAEEAFKKVSKAVQCLTNAEAKQVYDRYGDEEHVPRSQHARYQQDFMTLRISLMRSLAVGRSIRTTINLVRERMLIHRIKLKRSELSFSRCCQFSLSYFCPSCRILAAVILEAAFHLRPLLSIRMSAPLPSSTCLITLLMILKTITGRVHERWLILKSR